MKRNSLLSIAIAIVVLSISLGAAKEKKIKLDGIKCPVSGKAVKDGTDVAFNKGKVFFCCNNCPKAFKKDSKKFAAKANHQLVATGQAKQQKCSIKLRKLNPKTKISVAGVDVSFCCNGCKGQATKAEGDAQIALVFGNKNFAKAFQVGKKKADDDEDDDDDD